jgi:hypothetical protein
LVTKEDALTDEFGEGVSVSRFFCVWLGRHRIVNSRSVGLSCQRGEFVQREYFDPVAAQDFSAVEGAVGAGDQLLKGQFVSRMQGSDAHAEADGRGVRTECMIAENRAELLSERGRFEGRNVEKK